MTGHAQRQHRRFSPSQAERTIGCHGSANLLARVPARASSEYAIEGTKAHEVLEAALVNGEREAAAAHREYSSVCMEDLNTWDNQFYFAIDVCLNYVYAILDEHPDAELYTERFVNPPSEAAPGETGGYCDVSIYIPSLKLLYTVDYKHGAGIAKDADTPQLKQYGGGFVFDPESPVHGKDIDKVILVIVQPRAHHEDGIIREYETTPYELWEYLEEYDGHVVASLEPDAPLSPDDGGKTSDHCRFCDANTVCPAREAKAVRAVGDTFKAVSIAPPSLPAPQGLDLERLGFIRQQAPAFRKWLDDVGAHCKELSMAGYHVPGSKLVQVQERRSYYGDEQEVAAKAAALIGCDPSELMKLKLLPLTQVEKVVVEAFKKRVSTERKKQAAADAKQAFAFLTLKQSSGNLTLVDEDDARPAVRRGTDTFTQVAGLLQAPTQETTE